MVRLMKEVRERLQLLEKLVTETTGDTAELHPTGLKLKSGEMFHFTRAEIAWLSDHYPGVDMERELTNMAEWCEHNPSRRKTATGIKRFVSSWLKKQVNNVSHNTLGFLE
jgi:hypothetical protein